jgi:hypothetical protein
LAVIERAKECCEYCYKPQVSFLAHEVDHVIARKHGGETTEANLAFACFECNRYKGSDIASLDPDTGQLTALFNPRNQSWVEHFRFVKGRIEPLTAVGRTTVFLLRLNDTERIEERIALHIGEGEG